MDDAHAAVWAMTVTRTLARLTRDAFMALAAHRQVLTDTELATMDQAMLALRTFAERFDAMYRTEGTA
jgi:hypothetical protein